MTTKTPSALERLRAYLVGRSGLHQYAESPRTEMREIIAAFEDEQRQRNAQAKQLLDTIYALNVRTSKAVDYLRKQRVDFGILQRVRAILDGGDDT